jgi:primosomal protein N' (replication factor Y) (superfamily II helicase)
MILSMNKKMIVSVAVPSIFWEGLDYLVPASISSEFVLQGQRVLVPLGKRKVVGLILKKDVVSDLPVHKLKPIESLLESEPLVSVEWLDFMIWVSDYYHYPIGQVVMTAMPQRLRQAKTLPKADVLPEGLVKCEESGYELTDEQHQALESIKQTSDFKVFLLNGVTGSGKTEVYMQATMRCLERGKKVLILVPEIGLTPQALERFQQRFAQVPVLELHSAVAQVKKAKHWLAVSTPGPMIVVGTRSAVFAPFLDLAMIVVDEEHDVSFKQQTGLRYSARDCAIKRAQLLDIPVVLGSATPSLESLLNVQKGNYQELVMARRVNSQSLPSVSLVDMRRLPTQSGLSEAVIARMKSVLTAGQQVLLFINRRGYAPVLMCHHCGWVVSCSHCESRLVFHKTDNRLRCHQCDRTSSSIKYCQECKQSELTLVGYGTQRLDEELSSIFEGHPIIRVDRDTTRRKNSMAGIISDIKESKAAILLGTQMLSKGHHFPDLSLVVMLDLDGGLLSVDFRSEERLAQLIWQVAGRAGRSHQLGEVIIQTHYPEHPLFQAIVKGDYALYMNRLLQQRTDVTLPPASFMALLNAESKQYEKSELFLNRIKKTITGMSETSLSVLGPVPAPLSKRRDYYRGQLIIKSNSRRSLHRVVGPLVRNLQNQPDGRQVKWSIDIDPVDLS